MLKTVSLPLINKSSTFLQLSFFLGTVSRISLLILKINVLSRKYAWSLSMYILGSIMRLIFKGGSAVLVLFISATSFDHKSTSLSEYKKRILKNFR
jgi:hypothetical protein